MAITKTEVISVRVLPDIKAALVSATQAERRSLAWMLGVIPPSCCGVETVNNGILVPSGRDRNGAGRARPGNSTRESREMRAQSAAPKPLRTRSVMRTVMLRAGSNGRSSNPKDA